MPVVLNVRITPVQGLRGTIAAPPDKSITHRAILFAAISDGPVRISNTLDSEDTAATLGAIERCGVVVEGELGGELVIHGVGLRGLKPPPALDCLNAGTLMRLLTGILLGQTGDRIVLDGDDSLRGRPMLRIANPLKAMGAEILTAPGGTPPLLVAPGLPLTAMAHRLPVASAQVKSCLLLAGLYAHGTTWVSEPAPSRDHTERMLQASGVILLREDDRVGVSGPVERLRLPDLTVPGDPSSAGVLIAAGALLADPEIRITGVNLNPSRLGLVRVAERMGARVTIEPSEDMAGEPFGDIVIRRSGTLHATEVTGDEVPSLIDELPLVALLGVFAAGTTVVRGAGELRVKESDRVATVVAALRSLGAQIEEREDGFSVRGTGRLIGGEMSSDGDHRLAMLGALAGLVSHEGVRVQGFDAVNVSYPGFAQDLARLGAVAT